MNTSDISLLESPANLKAQSVAPSLKQKLGPHHDLLSICDFEHSFEYEKYEGQGSLSKSVGKELYKALSAQDAPARVAGARQAVENSKGTCGLAWLVLAREGVNSTESARIYSQRAIDRIKHELHEANFGDYCLYNDTYTVALADAAEMAFNAGQEREAIAMLKQQLDAEITDEFHSDSQIILREQLANLLMQQGDAKEAQAILNAHPDNIESWHYLNALAHFVIDGDTLISRSALACAFKAGTITAQKILGKLSIFEHDSDHFDQIICIDKAATAWLSNEKALIWLKETLNNPHSLIARESIAIALHRKDKKRWELWDSRETSAAYYLEMENYKEAAKEFKAALREAERIDYSYFPFFNTMTGMLALNQESETKLDEVIRNRLEQRVQRSTQNCPKDALAALHLHSFAKIYKEMNDLERAANCATKALQIAETLLGSIAISMAEVVEIKQLLAEIYYAQDFYAEALTQSEEAIALQERYLGNKNFDLLVSLELAHDCCQQLGDLDDTAILANKIKAIEPFVFG
ncbi:hypothetical protein BH11CYA1_BH11CYA1_37390 [soil metagenome]